MAQIKKKGNVLLKLQDILDSSLKQLLILILKGDNETEVVKKLATIGAGLEIVRDAIREDDPNKLNQGFAKITKNTPKTQTAQSKKEPKDSDTTKIKIQEVGSADAYPPEAVRLLREAAQVMADAGIHNVSIEVIKG